MSMAQNTPYLAAGTGSDETTLHVPAWHEIVLIVVERAWVGVTVALLVFLYFWYGALRETPYYRSTASLMVEAQIPQLLSFQEAVAFNIRNLEYFYTHIKALHSRTMMAQAIENAGLAERPGFTPGVGPGSRQAEAALRYVRITPVEQSRMIEITAEHPDPAIAADLANALARAYIRQDLDNRMRASLQAVEWLRTRADEYRVNLERGLLELQQYRESTQSVSLEEDQNIVIAKLKALNSALTAAQTERIGVETQWNSVNERVAAGADTSDLTALLSDSQLTEAQRNWLVHRQEREAIQRRYRSGHPDYQVATEREQQSREYYENMRDRAIKALRVRYELLVERERNLQEALRQQEQEAFNLDRKLVRYNDLRRHVEAEKGIYQAVIGRMKEASLMGSLPSELIHLVETAQPAPHPFRPQRRRVIGKGVIFGVAFGLASIFGLYFSAHRLSRSDEIERILELPVLGSIPMITGKTPAELGTLAQEKAHDQEAEAFRTLRAELMLRPVNRRHACLLVTSAHAGEGKSLIASNLACVFAQDHKRTLLIGCDLRRPTLHAVFGTDRKHPGLAELLKQPPRLQSETDWQHDVIKVPEMPCLDVLVAGDAHGHPSDLVGLRRFADLLSTVREHYDIVILDAPPILGVSDALTILPFVDSVLFVVRHAFTHSRGASHAVRRIRASGIPVAGVVLNAFRESRFTRYYYRYCGYSYGSGGYKSYRAEPAEAKGVHDAG